MAKKSTAASKTHLAADEQEVWHAVKQLGHIALSVVGKAIEADTGLSGADFGVLSRLEDIGGGSLGQTELGRSLEWDKSRLSHHLTRMEARKLVRREKTGSARGVEVHILPEGQQAIAAARPVHAAAIRQHILQFIGPAERDVVLKLAAHLAAHS
ncbi:MarR family winged helix-turn-helix transcriptional regulator [Undibacterium sp. TJN25]|uniref:MarR family winged helix-turn-helix transcriptional regulator n=1 Tax=Undibacterium sp. TJN25 TaxID=3413056 RepID=UPI003BF0DC14